MSQVFKIHPRNPQLHLLRQVAQQLMKGALAVYPTDSAYALGCQLTNKEGIQRLRQIRQLNSKHPLTVVCRDIAEVAHYAQLDDSTFRLLKAYTPGPYTFLLPATKQIPKYLAQMNQKKVIGIRIPDHIILHDLLEMLEVPLVTSTLILPGAELPLLEPEAIHDMLGRRVDLIIDGGSSGLDLTTIIDLVEGYPKIIREGKGDITPFK
ncbi:L-threonylcarbamoyladenylate synthase [Rickettsiella massiliensis]|uniref:L-threonylcarbamoyladenylate synthase n=1 Tax=Rickettsiella massiliensis TaxID=676517 RepID=UPI00029B14A4|nr:L-threonylcarbamoyladenylate synthase [Rickettsiella massiliensis]